MYSPEFSTIATVSVRRLAWALNKSMPKTVDLMVSLMPSLVEPSKVCMSCKDNTKCHACIFSRKFARQEQAALAVL
jgi:recombinational DNA repair protein RecR